ncbi:hypothetical protein LJR013_003181 [Pseudarthrobacter oxydans]|uniref:hypothetical protein n=1 Tax=Pseudarthrobacter oxydans TaxID=1671 RepID=UPI003ED03626
MTIVNIDVQATVSGAEVPAHGSLRWEPSGRRVRGDGALVLPAGFRAELVDGQATVEVEPSTSLWAWSVTEFFVGQPAKRRLLAVPPEGPVNYTDLVEVDPVTLDTALTVSPDPDNPGFYLIGV